MCVRNNNLICTCDDNCIKNSIRFANGGNFHVANVDCEASFFLREGPGQGPFTGPPFFSSSGCDRFASVPSTLSAGRQSLSSRKVHICRLQNSNSAASSVTIRIQIKSKIFVGDRRFGALEFPMWNFNSRVSRTFPKTRDGEPKPKMNSKKKKKPSLESCCGAPHKTARVARAGARGPGGTRAHRPRREVLLDPTPLGGTVL